MIGGPACGIRKVLPDGAVEFYIPYIETTVSFEKTPKYPEPVMPRKYVYKQELDEASRCSRTQDGNAFRFTYRGIEDG